MSIKIGNRSFPCPSYAKFAFDDIHDEEFGHATSLVGVIPFLCPAAPLQSRLAERESKFGSEIDTLLWGMVAKYRDAMGESTDDEIFERLNFFARPMWVIIGPSLDHNPPARNFIVEFLTMCGPLDTDVDAMIGTDAFSTGIEGQADFDFTEFCEVFRGPSLPDINSLPAGLVALKQIVGVYRRLMLETACEAMPNLNEQYGELLGPIVVGILYTHFLTHGMEWSKDKDGDGATGAGQVETYVGKFSGLTMSEFWRDMGGWHMIIALLMIAHKVRLSQKVLGSKLMTISLARAGDICILLNALAGLHRDVAMKQLDSPITYAVKVDGVSLQEAWAEALGKLHAAYADYRLTSQKLEQVFASEVDEIRRYNKIVDEYIDGCLYCYCIVERYGKTKQIQIVNFDE